LAFGSQEKQSGNLDKAEKVAGGFLVSRGDTSKMFDSAHKANGRRVEHEAFEIRVLPDLPNASLHAPFASPIEPLEDRVSFSESFGKVAPWSPRPHNPTRGFDEQPIVFGCTSGNARFAGQRTLDLHSSFVRDLVLPHHVGSSLNRNCDKVS
jgi:hypothetical protein